MNTQAILRYFHLHVHGDEQQKQEAEAMLLIFEEEARRDAEDEKAWAESRQTFRQHNPGGAFFATALDILHNK